MIMAEKEKSESAAVKEEKNKKEEPKIEKTAKKTEQKKVSEKKAAAKKEKKKDAKKEDQGKRPEKQQKKDIIFTVGKRKLAVARCTIKPGVGRVLINSQPMDIIDNEVVRLMVSEPFIVMGSNDWKAYDFSINLRGGGVMGQAEAARQAIARGLVEIFGDSVRKKFLEYNRSFLAYDPRRTEPHKPPRSSQGPRRYKQRSKR